MTLRRLLVPAGLTLAATTLLTGCAGDPPYAQTDYRYHQQGQVQICYNSHSTPEQVAAVAEEICNRYKRTAVLWQTQTYQCEWRNPNLATFYCTARPGETPPPVIDKHAPLRHDSPINQ